MASHQVTFSWSKDNATLTESPSVVISRTQSSDTPVFYNYSLMIPDVQISDNGTYACHVDNQFSSNGPSGSASSRDFYLFVQS
jgi:hypothetical protein